MIASWEQLVPILAVTLAAATPLVFAGLGELVAEKSGVMNLGVEGMMLIGAVAGFAGALQFGFIGGVICGALAGALAALPFAFLTLTLATNQAATGLALTIFGIGLSAFVGQYFVSYALPGLKPWALPGLADIPLIGQILFAQTPMVYLSWLVFGLLAWALARSRWGLILRAVGESPDAAHAIGYPVTAIRYAATCFGGAMAGIGGAYLSTVYTPLWVQNMTAGRGWIAVALVVFAAWRPGRLMLGAYLFGGMTILQLHAQGLGLAWPSQLLAAVPYLATIVVLVLISRDHKRLMLSQPASLGRPWMSND